MQWIYSQLQKPQLFSSNSIISTLMWNRKQKVTNENLWRFGKLLSCFCWRSLRRSTMWEPISLQCTWRFSLSRTLSTASPPAEQTGFPPKVLNCIFWASTLAISGVVTTAPSGKPLPIPWILESQLNSLNLWRESGSFHAKPKSTYSAYAYTLKNEWRERIQGYLCSVSYLVLYVHVSKIDMENSPCVTWNKS